MVKNPDIPAWQRSAIYSLERYIDIRTKETDDDFKEHIDFLRNKRNELDISGYPTTLYPSYLTQFMHKFRFPIEMKSMLKNYIISGDINLTLMRPGIAALDDRDNTSKLNIDETDEEQYWEEYTDRKTFKLIIPDGVTTSEIIDYIRTEKIFIDEKLGNTNKTARKSKTSAPWIAIRIVNLNRQGLSNDAIATKARIENWPCNPLGPNEVSVILKRAKDRRL